MSSFRTALVCAALAAASAGCGRTIYEPHLAPSADASADGAASDASADGRVAVDAGRDDAGPGDGAIVVPPDTDIGEPCELDSDCRAADDPLPPGVTQTACIPDAMSWYNGYCTAYCHMTWSGSIWDGPRLERSDCPEASVCVPQASTPPEIGVVADVGLCFRECRVDADCRVDEGYLCRRTELLGSELPALENGFCAPYFCVSRGSEGWQCDR